MAVLPTDACCLVLAAGRGRRMGGPKALMQVHGQPWWRLQRERLAAAGVESLWIASPDVAAAWTDIPDAPRHLTTAPAADAPPHSTPEPLPMFASLMLGVGCCSGRCCRSRSSTSSTKSAQARGAATETNATTGIERKRARIKALLDLRHFKVASSPDWTQ